MSFLDTFFTSFFAFWFLAILCAWLFHRHLSHHLFTIRHHVWLLCFLDGLFCFCHRMGLVDMSNYNTNESPTFYWCFLAYTQDTWRTASCVVYCYCKGQMSSSKGQRPMTKRQKRLLQKNIKRFWKKTVYRLFGRLVEIAALVGIGSALGLHLVRY